MLAGQCLSAVVESECWQLCRLLLATLQAGWCGFAKRRRSKCTAWLLSWLLRALLAERLRANKLLLCMRSKVIKADRPLTRSVPSLPIIVDLPSCHQDCVRCGAVSQGVTFVVLSGAGKAGDVA